MDRKIGKRVMILSRHYQAYIAHLLKDSEFTYAQFNVLRILKDYNGISQEGLVNMLMIDKARISRVVSQLEEKQLIIKTTSTTDKRGVCLFISEKGNTLLPEVEAVLRKSGDRMLDGLSEEQVKEALHLLDHMCRNVSKGDLLDE